MMADIFPSVHPIQYGKRGALGMGVGGSRCEVLRCRRYAVGMGNSSVTKWLMRNVRVLFRIPNGVARRSGNSVGSTSLAELRDDAALPAP